ncbi:MAG: ATP--guanido phosphotransferase [Candidatus Eisenbacteria bacterium]|nr:ATP--guanido phosphotransferase [Candidatus Eisenbacteria bacterium]
MAAARLDAIMSGPAAWLSGAGPHSEVFLSTRVRVARNLDNVPFPERASNDALVRVRERVLDAVARNNYLMNARVVVMDDADSAGRQALVERHIISPAFAACGEGRACIIGEREVVSGMINEEDHLRLHCIRSGLQPVDAWRLLERVDSELDRNLHYAFSSDWGFLTACPTNVGTGIRVSVLAHLAALARMRRATSVLAGISKLGLSVRGFYGEGSQATGSFFQISNQTTLGQSEDDIAYTVERVAGQLVSLEEEAREDLLEREPRRLEDEVFRAYGALRNARLLKAEEVMELCSVLRLGVALGLIDEVSLGTVNRLLVVTQPGHLMMTHGRSDASAAWDAARAELVRRELSEPN